MQYRISSPGRVRSLRTDPQQNVGPEIALETIGEIGPSVQRVISNHYTFWAHRYHYRFMYTGYTAVCIAITTVLCSLSHVSRQLELHCTNKCNLETLGFKIDELIFEASFELFEFILDMKLFIA